MITPGWGTLAKVGAVLAVQGAVVFTAIAYGRSEYAKGLIAGRAELQQQADAQAIRERDAAIGRADRANAAKERAEQKLQEAADHAEQERQTAAVALDAARADAGRLRDTARAAARRAAADRAVCAAPAAGASAATPDTGLLQADMLGSVAARTGDYAGEADRRGADVADCVARYNVVRQQLIELQRRAE